MCPASHPIAAQHRRASVGMIGATGMIEAVLLDQVQTCAAGDTGCT